MVGFGRWWWWEKGKGLCGKVWPRRWSVVAHALRANDCGGHSVSHPPAGRNRRPLRQATAASKTRTPRPPWRPYCRCRHGAAPSARPLCTIGRPRLTVAAWRPLRLLSRALCVATALLAPHLRLLLPEASTAQGRAAAARRQSTGSSHTRPPLLIHVGGWRRQRAHVSGGSREVARSRKGRSDRSAIRVVGLCIPPGAVCPHHSSARAARGSLFTSANRPNASPNAKGTERSNAARGCAEKE